jgi:predicted amidohydrolase YtcJ
VVIAGRPVILQSRDGHAIWVSKRTLEANAPYPDTVEGGVIMRDEAGNPTGEVHLSFYSHYPVLTHPYPRVFFY